MATVLVTGARGFLGRHVAREFARRGWRVIGIGHGAWEAAERSSWGLKEWYEADVSYEALADFDPRPDVLIHCAGGSSVAFSVARPEEDFGRTVGTTEAVLRYLRAYAPRARAVLASSAAVYGDAALRPTPESQPLAPLSPYGKHKAMAEALFRRASEEQGLSAAIVRLFSVYGSGLRKQLLWDACVRLASGATPCFGGDGSETRDWLHVDDAAVLLALAGERASPNCEAVNGGSGRALTVGQILAELYRGFGRTDAPRFSGASRSGDPRHYLADIRLAKTWGWTPAVDWRRGVSDYVAWFRAGAS